MRVYAGVVQQAERLWARRLRWRLRGAWQWPAFAALTAVDGVLLARLPFTGDGSGLYGGVLLAGFFNLVAVAVLAPAGGLLLRRVRPDLPRAIAADYAGAWLLVAVTALLVAGGLAHRPALQAARGAEAAAVAAAHAELRGPVDLRRLEPDYFRACAPAAEPRRWRCVFVSTAQSPPGITRDPEQIPNSDYRALP
jgi:hypothetical protein